MTVAGDSASSGSAPAAPRRLLVVDDEAPIRSALRRFFTRRGWEVDEADDGRAALDRLVHGDDRYDAVICDIQMPNLSGTALYDAIARDRPALLERCIFSTGDAQAPEAAKFVARTHCRMLEKPFELAQLAAIVDALPGRAASP